MAQQTAVEWLIEQLIPKAFATYDITTYNAIQQAKQMEKEQSIDLIKHTAMFMGASNFDKEIASMTFKDVYNSYYNETYEK